jgi:iron only hydrogenase large subunit-like protein
MANAFDLIKQIKAGRDDLHFIEVMACPGSCISGGGQPLTKNAEAVKARMKTLYDIDEKESIKVAHKNPSVIDLLDKYQGREYESFRENFKTSFRPREVMR